MCILPKGSSVSIVALLGTGFAFELISHGFPTANTLLAERREVCPRGTAGREVVGCGEEAVEHKATVLNLKPANASRLSWSMRSLTEVAVLSLIIDEAHGDVPASCSAITCVARPLASQGIPGQSCTLFYHSNGKVRRGRVCKNESVEWSESAQLWDIADIFWFNWQTSIDVEDRHRILRSRWHFFVLLISFHQLYKKELCFLEKKPMYNKSASH